MGDFDVDIDISQYPAQAGEEPINGGSGSGVQDETPPTRQEAKAAPEPPKPNEPWWKAHENDEVEFQASKGLVKAPFAKVREYAQKGYHYAQEMQRLAQERQQHMQEREAFQKHQTWKDVAEYADKDPEWASYVREQFQNRDAWKQNAEQDPMARRLMQLEGMVKPLSEKLTAYEADRLKAQEAEADKAFEQEIASVKEKYAKPYGIDLSVVDDATGLPLVDAIVKHGASKGLHTFQDAFLSYLGPDKLFAAREEALKRQEAEKRQKLAKQGFIGRTPTPTQPRKAPPPPKGQFQDTDSILAELESGAYG